jgi:amino-acid N-acetyltransferase
LIRKANINEVKTIYKIIMEQAEAGHLLPRPISGLYSQVRSISLWVDDTTQEVAACGSLEVIWEDLAEIRSLAVRTERQGAGIGTELILTLLNEAREMQLKRVFVLTYRPKLFERQGFSIIDKSTLPHKIWADCVHCTKFPECDEIALAKDL